MLKFYVKVFYVMGKALSGELSCPCGRSCYENRVDSGEGAHNEPPHLDLHCLPSSL